MSYGRFVSGLWDALLPVARSSEAAPPPICKSTTIR